MMEPDLSLALELLDDAPTGVALLDVEGRIGWVNRRLTRMLGVPSSILIGADRDTLARHGLERLLDKEGAITLRPPDGPTRWLHCERRLLGDGQLDPVEARFFLDPASCTPTDEGEAVVDSHWRHVTTDPTTGMLNRRALLLALEPQVARTRRYGRPLSAVALAVARGDEPRRLAVAQVLNAHLRWADLVGVDEATFLLALPETDLAAAGALVEKVRNALAEAKDPAGEVDGDLLGTLRFGIAEWRRGDDAARLVHRACEAAATEATPPVE